MCISLLHLFLCISNRLDFFDLLSEETASYSTTNITNVSITPRRARFINRITSDPEVQTALSVAESIFSEAMNAEFLEFAPIVAEVAYGEPIDISFLTRGSYILTVVADGKAYSKKFVKR